MDDRLKALSQRQRECLRLVARGLEAKEIGRALGISDLTVKNHLSAARATLGTARSIDAARLLAAAEARDGVGDGGGAVPPCTGTWSTGTPPGIADRSYDDVDGTGQSAVMEPPGGLGDGGALPPPPLPLGWALSPPARRGPRNDLGIGARLAIVVALTVMLIAAVGFFVEASRGLRF